MVSYLHAFSIKGTGQIHLFIFMLNALCFIGHLTVKSISYHFNEKRKNESIFDYQKFKIMKRLRSKLPVLHHNNVQ